MSEQRGLRNPDTHGTTSDGEPYCESCGVCDEGWRCRCCLQAEVEALRARNETLIATIQRQDSTFERQMEEHEELEALRAQVQAVREFCAATNPIRGELHMAALHGWDTAMEMVLQLLESGEIKGFAFRIANLEGRPRHEERRMSAQWRGLHNDVYRVQVGKPWWRRKWQAEWELCHFAQRGYTRRGVLAMARLRRTHTRVNDAYVRARIIIRRNVTQREWYAARYTVTGARHSADGRGGGAR